MSEEVKDAAYTIPRAMLMVYLVNMVILFPGMVTICYHIPDLEAALADSTTYPAVYIMKQAMSVPWITVVLTITCFLLMASNITYLAAVTRDLFAFSRDQGLPFSHLLRRVHPKSHIPVNACTFSCIVAILLSMIYIGSPVAFYAITSLLTVSLLQCYSMSIGCMLWRRVYHPETLPEAKFSLGRLGVPINAAAVLYSLWAFFWSFWPLATPVTAAGFNWALPVFVVVLIVAMLYFVLVARHGKYVGPVTQVQGRKGNAVI